MNNKELVLSVYPQFTEEDINEKLNDYSSCKVTVCEYCGVSCEESELNVTGASGDGYNEPIEPIIECPHCCAENPELVKPELKEWLDLDRGWNGL